jgi:hypothetical protein
MPLDLSSLIALRPILYHLTARENLTAIWAGTPPVLVSAADLIRAKSGGPPAESLLRQRREKKVRIKVAGRPIVLRDQEPLHAGHVALPEGTTFEDVVQLLNERVYFWPGDNFGPIPAGRHHFARYTVKEPEDCVVFAIPFADLLAANPANPPLLTRCNSGSPRSHPVTGKQPRGMQTFLPASRFEGTASDVVEVTFYKSVWLPRDVIELVSGAGAVARGWTR